MKNKLREYRILKGLSINQLAARTGLSPSAISLIENGKRIPNANTLAKICQILELQPEDLFPELFNSTKV